MASIRSEGANFSVQAMDEEDGWQPIETAPIEPFNKDRWYAAHSPQLLLWNGGFIQIGSYRYTESGKGRWKGWSGVIAPTHWMPLPPPPDSSQ